MRVPLWKLLHPNRLLTGEATRMRIPRRKACCTSRVARRHAIYTDGSYSQENLSDEAARALCQRCTMHSACRMQNTARTTRVTLCILANWLLRAVVTYISQSPSLRISLLLFVGMKDGDSLPSTLHALIQLRKLYIFTAVYEKRIYLPLFSRFLLYI